MLRLETPHEIFGRVFSELKPRTQPPPVHVEFCRFAGATSLIRLEQGRLTVRITDALEGAPESVIEALAHLLLCKLYRKQPGRAFVDRYRRYLNRKEMQRNLRIIRQARGHKLASPPEGSHYNLDELFDELNFGYFFGLMAKPGLGWSLRRSRTTLGHYDPSHHVIILNKILDDPNVPRVAVEYVMFHEMLHLRYPAEERAARRCVHTPEFKQAERQFARYREAKDLLKKL